MTNRRAKICFPAFNGYEVRVILAGNVTRTCSRIQPGFGYCIAAFIPGEDSKRRGYLVLGLTPDAGTIAHEASHAIQELFRWAGARRDEETFAYHLDYLVGRVHKFLAKGKADDLLKGRASLNGTIRGLPPDGISG
jgi:hypothetical protein